MYAYDENDFLIASGGTAGYCAICKKYESPYSLEYIQAWLNNPITERIIRISGSDFEGGFVARGTFLLSTLPFIELDFNDPIQKNLHDMVSESTREIYRFNRLLLERPSKTVERSLLQRKSQYIQKVEHLISKAYRMDFSGGT